MDTLRDLLSNDFMPHGHCYFWRPDILWTHVLGDAAIAAAYFCIPAILLYFLFKKRPQGIPFWWVLILFAAFIYLCGVTHIFGIITVWEPVYVIEGWLKVATAIVSVVTAIALIPLVPKALSLKSPEELARANTALSNEIRERDRVQRALEISNQELEDITSITAHDLQAPLRRMITFTDLLRDKLSGNGGNPEELTEIMDSIVRNGQNMRQHLEDVITFSTISRFGAESSAVDVGKLLREITDNLGKLGSSGEIEFIIDEMPVIHTSRQVLYHTFHNLLDNAIKYRARDRKLVIHIHAEKAQTHEGQTEWVFSVKDNGIGIEPEHSDKIFKLFGRLHSKEAYPGSGIGLATVKKLLLNQGGRIWLNSALDEGSCFSFSLPVTAGA